MNQSRKIALSTPSDREIAWTREFDAPSRLVFDAYTKPELIRRWLLGPPGWEMTECRVDLRVGGEYRWAWKHPEQGSMGMGGVYREIIRPRKIVSTEKYDQSWYAGEGIGTVLLVEVGDKTTVTTTMLYETMGGRNMALQSAMETGLNTGYDLMDNILADSKKRGRRILQSVLALVGGFAVVAGLSMATDLILESAGLLPPLDKPQDYTEGMLVVALGYRILYSVIGFFLAALWAPLNPMRHALVLGFIGTLFAVLGAIANWGFGHHWYAILLAAVTLPCAWIGVKILSLAKKTKEN